MIKLEQIAQWADKVEIGDNNLAIASQYLQVINQRGYRATELPPRHAGNPIIVWKPIVADEELIWFNTYFD